MDSGEKTAFKGSFFLFLKHEGFYICLALLLVSLFVFGPLGYKLFLIALVLSLPLMILAVSKNRFSFDDEKRQIRPAFGRNIPYEDVQSIDILERGGSLKITADLGTRGKSVLISFLDNKPENRIPDAFSKRFPAERVHYRTSSYAKVQLALIVIPIVLFAVFHGYVFERFPETRSFPVKRPFLTFENLPPDLAEIHLKGYYFSLSRNLRGTIHGNRIKAVIDNIDVTITVEAEIDKDTSPQKKFIFSRIIGFRDSFDWWEMGYYARYGVLPLTMKALLLHDLEKPSITDIQHPLLKGFLIQCRQGNKHVAVISISDRVRHQEIYIVARSQNEIPGDLINSLISGIKHSDKII